VSGKLDQMLMKKKSWLLLLLIIPLGSWCPITDLQYLRYDIFVSNNKIGEVLASKNSKGGLITYSVQTNLSFRLLEKYDVNYQLSSSYKNNYLTESALKNIVNGKLEDDVHIKWDGQQYTGQANKKTVSFKEKIKYSIAKLYFHEPIGIERVFSEKFTDFQKIKTQNPNEYTLFLEDGSKTHYKYLNGICTEVNSNKSFFKIQIKLRS
jgi:Tol biopolymer transport system component